MIVHRFVVGLAFLCSVTAFARGLLGNGWEMVAAVLVASAIWAYIDHKIVAIGIPPNNPPSGGGVI